MIENVIYSTFANDEVLKGLVGNDSDGNVKIYPFVIPDNTVTPAIVYYFETETTIDTKDDETVRVLPFSVMVATTDHINAAEINKAINDAGRKIRGKQSGVLIHKCKAGDVSRDYDPTGKVYIYTTDFLIHFENI